MENLDQRAGSTNLTGGMEVSFESACNACCTAKNILDVSLKHFYV